MKRFFLVGFRSGILNSKPLRPQLINIIPNFRRMLSNRNRVVYSWILWGSAFLFALTDFQIRAFWPSVVALGVVLLIRRVLTGLLAGGTAGVIIIAGGNPIKAYLSFFSDHLIPALQDSWKIGAIIFTLLLGGFVALIEKGGGLQTLVGKLLAHGGDPARRLQWSTLIMGLIVFFDGLANSIMVGRIMRKLADRCGVSRVKLAYLVDSTSSAVACLAFVSTWIATQLAMIREGYVLAGRGEEVAPYALFFESIPYNFYCIFTLMLIVVSIAKQFNPGSMEEFEWNARERLRRSRASADLAFSENDGTGELDGERTAHWLVAVVPILVLVFFLVFGIYLSGGESPWPVTRAKIVTAFGGSEVVIILISASALASLVAYALYPRRKNKEPPSEVYAEGVRTLFLPVLILLGAWVLSSTLSDLQAAEVISRLLEGRMPLFALPGAIFLVGGVISFTTGSAWGTMIILMPLSVSVVFGLSGGEVTESEYTLLATVVGAVFSGAVFGDHCSPISDTTIISSIACDVEPHDHVRTQIPYALLAAFTAIAVGFVPAGIGISPFYSLLVGAAVLWIFPKLSFRKGNI